MKVHHYDETTGEYLGSSEAMESPLEPGVPLVPAHATMVELPVDVEGEARYFDGLKWRYRVA